jgi:hypothetical protein
MPYGRKPEPRGAAGHQKCISLNLHMRLNLIEVCAANRDFPRSSLAFGEYLVAAAMALGVLSVARKGQIKPTFEDNMKKVISILSLISLMALVMPVMAQDAEPSAETPTTPTTPDAPTSCKGLKGKEKKDCKAAKKAARKAAKDKK